jgi:hypothetical protein
MWSSMLKASAIQQLPTSYPAPSFPPFHTQQLSIYQNQAVLEIWRCMFHGAEDCVIQCNSVFSTHINDCKLLFWIKVVECFILLLHSSITRMECHWWFGIILTLYLVRGGGPGLNLGPQTSWTAEFIVALLSLWVQLLRLTHSVGPDWIPFHP